MEPSDFIRDWKRELDEKETTPEPRLLNPVIREARFDVPKLPESREEYKPYSPTPDLCCFSPWLNDTTSILQLILSGFTSKGCTDLGGGSSVNGSISVIDGFYNTIPVISGCNISVAPFAIGTYVKDFYSTPDCTGPISTTKSGSIYLEVLMYIAGEIQVNMFAGLPSPDDGLGNAFDCTTKDFLGATGSVGNVWTPGSITIDSL